MEYFTYKEAQAIMSYSSVFRCANWDENPAREQARALMERVRTDEECSRCPFWATVYGFNLGRATGIREERQRRKGAGA